jgi:hypothetical protein
MNMPQVLQRTLIGNIIRTVICFVSLRTFLARGIFAGSKSAQGRQP